MNYQQAKESLLDHADKNIIAVVGAEGCQCSLCKQSRIFMDCHKQAEKMFKSLEASFLGCKRFKASDGVCAQCTDHFFREISEWRRENGGREMMQLKTIIRDFEKILLTEGYDAPVAIEFTARDCERLKGEFADLFRHQDSNEGDVCKFHGIIIEAPKGFKWR